MKALVFLLLCAVVGSAIWLRQPAGVTPVSPDPVKAMEAVVARFPDATQIDDTRMKLVNVSYNVRKTDSLVNPLVGELFFTRRDRVFVKMFDREIESDMAMKMVFHWEGERWRFHQLICMENGLDHTNGEGGIEFMNTPPVRTFLASCGYEPPAYHSTNPARVVLNSATPTPLYIPRPVALPQRPATPNPVEVNRQILEKYGARR